MTVPVSTNPFAATAPASPGESTPVVASSPFASAAPIDPNAPQPFGDPTDTVFEFNLDGISGSMFVPAGSYLFRLADITEEVSANSGNNMWVFHLAVIQKADGNASEHAGKVMKRFCALTPSALGILAATVDAFYLRQENGSPRFRKSEAINRMVYGEVVDGEYNGRKTTNLQNLYPYTTNPGAKWSAAGINLT